MADAGRGGRWACAPNRYGLTCGLANGGACPAPPARTHASLCPPGTSAEQVRFAALASGKTLLSPQPRLRTGFFSALHRDSIPPEALLEACTSGGWWGVSREVGD